MWFSEAAYALVQVFGVDKSEELLSSKTAESERVLSEACNIPAQAGFGAAVLLFMTEYYDTDAVRRLWFWSYTQYP
jgi:hypothetical protein